MGMLVNCLYLLFSCWRMMVSPCPTSFAGLLKVLAMMLSEGFCFHLATFWSFLAGRLHKQRAVLNSGLVMVFMFLHCLWIAVHGSRCSRLHSHLVSLTPTQQAITSSVMGHHTAVLLYRFRRLLAGPVPSQYSFLGPPFLTFILPCS